MWLVYGGIVSARWLAAIARERVWIGVAAGALGLLVLPGLKMVEQYGQQNGSKNFFAYDYGRNLLATLPPHSIIFTYGDLDTFPLWYLKTAEKERPDVTVLNIWLLSTPWYVRQVMLQDPDLPLKLSSAEIDDLGPKSWADTTISIETDDLSLGAEGSSRGTPHPGLFHVPPSIQNRYLMANDWLVLKMISENRFRRPIYFSAAGGQAISLWISDHLRLDGLAGRLMPDSAPAPDLAALRANLTERYSYRGFADSSVLIDATTTMMATNYWEAIYQYVEGIKGQSGASAAQVEKAKLAALIPPSRCPALSPEIVEWIKSN